MHMLRCLGGAALALAATAALAQVDAGAKADHAAAFARLDRNGDGVLSRREAAADPEVARRWDRFDANRDKLMSHDEFDRAKFDQEQQYLIDASITARVKAALLLKAGVPPGAVSVETNDGVVVLTGALERAEQVAQAGRTAAQVGGVRSIQNDLRAQGEPRSRQGLAAASR